MRTKDEQKKEALFKATMKLVNEIGFASSSVSKIAKEANVSPSTIYVFFKNKEDLLVSTYVDIKLNLSRAMLSSFDDSLPIRDILRNTWFGMFDYISKNSEQYQFIEQFANSPYSDLVNREEIEKSFEPLYRILQKGIDQKIIKNVPVDILIAFMFYPIYSLSNKRLCAGFKQNEQNIEMAFTLAWDAIKL